MKQKSPLSWSVAQRSVWLSGDILRSFDAELGKALDRIGHDDERRPIFLYISSGGGHVSAATDAIRRIERSKSPVIGIAHGFVASSAFYLLQGCDTRYAVPRTQLCFHQACMDASANEYHGSLIFTPERLKQELADLMMVNAVQAYVFHRRSNRGIDDILDALLEERVLGVRKAIAWGLLDGYYSASDLRRERRIFLNGSR